MQLVARLRSRRRPSKRRPQAARGIGRSAAVASVVAVACAGTGAIANGPVIRPYETDAVSRTSVDQPLHVLFSWRLEAPDGRFSGRGATRVAPPHHARLDLFGPRGEAYLMAALVDMELRLPAGADRTPLPPAPLLWAALGMFRPPEGAQLAATAREGETTRLDYVRDDERWTFRLERGRLRWAEWTGSDGRRTVELEGDAAHGLPHRAVYRDWPAFRELRLTVDEVNETQGFDAEIWTVGAR